MKLAGPNGHKKGVTSIFVDEGRIYTGSDDETIKIWDLEVTSYHKPNF